MAKRGPGKFDDDLAAAIYGASLDGGPDEEVGSSTEAPGTWAGIMRDGKDLALALERNEQDPNTREDVDQEELEFLRTEGRAGVILTESSSGSVSVVYYDDPKKLEKDWAECVEDLSVDDEEGYEGNRRRRANSQDDKDYLREETIEPFIEGKGPVFEVQTWTTGRRASRGTPLLGFRITMAEPGKAPETVFSGEDYSPSPMIDADSDQTIDDIVAFFVNDYDDDERTARQREVVKEYGDALSGEVGVRFGEDSEHEPNGYAGNRSRSNPQTRWNIYLGDEMIDAVYFDSDMTADEVKRSLINHDGYDSNIRVVEMPRRRTGLPSRPESRTANPQTSWDVYKGGGRIDTVFFAPDMTADEVKRSLVDHDGYDPSITVRKAKKRRPPNSPDRPRGR